MRPLLLQGPGPWERDSPGDKLNKDNVEVDHCVHLSPAVCVILTLQVSQQASHS